MVDRPSETAEYYRRREQRERGLARNALNPIVRNIHLELATSYADRARWAARVEQGAEFSVGPDVKAQIRR